MYQKTLSDCLTDCNGLNDANIISTGIGAILQKTWDKAVVCVHDRVNYNRMNGIFGAIWDSVSFKWLWGNDPKSASVKQISTIMSVYYNLVKDDSTYPEYEAYLVNNADKGQWTLINKVATDSGQLQDLTREALDQLEYASKDSSIPTLEFYHPRTFKEGVNLRKTPEDVNAIQNDPLFKTTGNILGILGWLASNMVPMVLIGGGTLILWKTGLLKKGFDYAKEKVTGKKSPGLGDKKQDNLFGPEYDAPKVWTLYELPNGDFGITADFKTTKENNNGFIKKLYASTDYETVKRKQSAMVKTDALFDKDKKSKS